ncbi:amino acid transporter [Gonapodya prolifera JEL478]|uniref:Amino acid transporter n=1 Tax=Gonapodya prolifera (strain JEL478) TaxID=1344416 RepID=A0A139ADR7_GONPJ|nr:amino acid transporter [Gonapodya prolifera JEL478]|eukprot:KXS14563.1 amino acid transporter [Gonapodya prolifera JEL478]
MATLSEDEIRLAKMGYKQEFNRGFKFIHNFGVSFSILSVIVGVNTLLSYALVAGGSAGAVLGWIVVSFFTILVGYSLTEICSAMPTAGGLYFWAARLGGEKWGPVLSWYTSWIVIIGGVCGFVSGSYSISQFVWSLVMVWKPDLQVTIAMVAVVAIGTILVAAILNSIHERVLGLLMEISVYTHIVGTVFVIIMVLVKAPTKQSASFVFQSFNNLTGQDSMGYAVLLGFLFPAWNFLGFDASAHIAEETVDSHIHAARGIYTSITSAVILGFAFLLALLFSIQDFDAILASPYPIGITQLYMDACGPIWTTVVLILVLICGICNVVCSMIANSRVVYAWSRDGGYGVKLSKFLYYAHPVTKLPLRGVWMTASLGMILSCIGFGSNVALTAFSSVSTIGLMVSYMIPIFAKVAIAGDSFKPGPLNLGRFSNIINWISVVWVGFLAVLMSLPSAYPVVAVNLNYAPIIFVFWVGVITAIWFGSAKHWFRGPVVHISEEDLANLEEKLSDTKAQKV